MASTFTIYERCTLTNLDGSRFSSKNFMVCSLGIFPLFGENMNIITFCLHAINLMNRNHMNILSVFYSYPIDIFFVFVVGIISFAVNSSVSGKLISSGKSSAESGEFQPVRSNYQAKNKQQK